MAHTYTRKVYYYETDQMGIVHHSNHIRMFEEARIQWLETIGIPYHTLESMGLMIPVLHAHCEYKRPLRFGDDFFITLTVSQMTGVRMTIAYELLGPDQKTVYATGSTGHAFVDKSMRPIRLQRTFPEVYEALLPKK